MLVGSQYNTSKTSCSDHISGRKEEYGDLILGLLLNTEKREEANHPMVSTLNISPHGSM
jgi:hypothetical protein